MEGEKGAHLRFRRVWVQINLLQVKDVVFGIVAELQRVLAWYIEIIADGNLLVSCRREPRASSDSGGKEERCEELHLCYPR